MYLAIEPQLLMTMPDERLIGFIFSGVFLFLLIIVLIPAIFYLITLQNTLKAVAPQNRKMDPGMVWLLLIPLFNLVWLFFVVKNISDSLEQEFRQRGASVESRPTYNIGLVYAILCCCSIIPILGILCSIASFVLWIIYWVKVNEYKNKLLRLPAGNSQDSQIFGNLNQ